MRSALVIAQVAVSLLLLVGAGLITRSLDAAEHASPGYDPTHVASVSLDMRLNAYTPVTGTAFAKRLLDTARATPGVESATLSQFTPLTLLEKGMQRITVEGHETRKGEDLLFLTNAIAPDYFRTLTIPVAAGREFDDHDTSSGAPVAMVNATLAERYYGSADAAIGRRVKVGDPVWRTIVGVARDVKYARVDEAPRPYVYVPFFQAYKPAMVLQTKGSGAVSALVATTREIVAAVDPDLKIQNARTLTEDTRGAFVFLQFMAFMLFVFGGTGVALAALGTYGLVSYTVKQSTQEIGIRMALGASAASVVRTCVGRGLRLGAIGAVVGLASAVGVGQLLRNLLFGVSPIDPISYAQAFAIVIGGVIVATLLPAWRASRTNPLRALRHR